jgi:hypothetical protein
VTPTGHAEDELRRIVNRETRAHKIDPHVEQSWQAIAHTGLPEYPAG